MKKIIAWSIPVLLSISSLSARTWTSSDGAKTFEGEVKAYDAANETVTVLINGREMTFSQSKLSEADIAYVKAWSTEANKPSVEQVLAAQKVGQNLTSRTLQRFNGKKFKSASMEKAPEYYLLYFSASW